MLMYSDISSLSTSFSMNELPWEERIMEIGSHDSLQLILRGKGLFVVRML